MFRYNGGEKCVFKKKNIGKSFFIKCIDYFCCEKVIT